ncbi:MAG: CAP domain-containing protein [Herminiimonas sp.]|nr:CAP domain-containing protein [Herminiimonas sp.]
MALSPFSLKRSAALLALLMLNACGGGGSSTSASTATTQANGAPAVATVGASAAADTQAVQPTGNTATDGLNWFNYRRGLLGLPTLARTGTIDTAAQGHSRYEQLNDTLTHVQTAGRAGFTGATPPDRLAAANYRFTANGYASGEVLSSTTDQSGFNAAEDLIAAVYHRFVIFEPMFRQAGAGSAVSSSGRTYFTVDFAANGLTPALGRGKFLVYPADGQANVAPGFFSDFETPDPVPDRNQVGYPISLHADITSTLTVTSFTVRPRNGTPMQTRLLVHASDPETPVSAAALIPLDVLASGATYDVQFAGTVDAMPVSRTWSFSTR